MNKKMNKPADPNDLKFTDAFDLDGLWESAAAKAGTLGASLNLKIIEGLPPMDETMLRIPNNLNKLNH